MTRIPSNGSGTPIVRVLLAFLFLSGVAYSQTVSYWFQGWQTKPNAQQAQAYFMLPGTNISFTYSNNRVIINGTGTNAGPSGTSCCQIVTFATNSLFSTNWTQSNSMWTNIVGSFQPLCANLFEWCGIGTNDFFLSVTQYIRGATNNIISGSNALWCDNLTNWCTVTPSDITNLVSNATNTLSTNLMTFVTNYVAAATNISGATGLVTNFFTTNLTLNATNLVWTNNSEAIWPSSQPKPDFIGGASGPNFWIRSDGSLFGGTEVAGYGPQPISDLNIFSFPSVVSFIDSNQPSTMSSSWVVTGISNGTPYLSELLIYEFADPNIGNISYDALVTLTNGNSAEFGLFLDPGDSAGGSILLLQDSGSTLFSVNDTLITGTGVFTGNGAGMTNLNWTNIVNITPGTNITFATNAGIVSINSTGGTGTSGFVTNEFTTNLSVTISQFQPACANLSNWCLISPSDITNAITNAVYWGTNTTASNILVTVSNSIYTTSNAIVQVGTPNVVFNDAGTTNYAGFGARGGSAAGGGNTAVGYQADAEGNTFGAGTSVGYQSQGHDAGVGVGYQADGHLTGVAVGVQANGNTDGVAIGYTASGAVDAVAIGRQAAAGPSGVAIGRQANGAAQGVAVGKQSSGANDGVGVGYFADGSTTGVALGQFAFANGVGNVAIGGSDTSPNKAQVTAGWGDSIELGRGSAAINGGLSFRGMGIIDSSANIFSSTISPTNGVIQQTYKTNGTLVCVTNKQFYLVYGTNELITLPDASLGTVSNIIYRFSSTNGYGSFIVTNATGTQRIRDGISLSYTNIGINEVGFISDGANWWLASKGKQIFPSASWSLSSTITLAQDTITNIPFSDLEFNNSQGIALKTNATFSRPTQLWVTNSGTYMITFSAVLRGPAGGGTISLWLRKGGSDVARTRTDQTFAGTTSQVTMTVNFFQNVGAPDFFELVAASHNATPPTIESSAANPTGYTAPAMPSIIVTINRVSDTWP